MQWGDGTRVDDGSEEKKRVFPSAQQRETVSRRPYPSKVTPGTRDAPIAVGRGPSKTASDQNHRSIDVDSAIGSTGLKSLRGSTGATTSLSERFLTSGTSRRHHTCRGSLVNSATTQAVTAPCANAPTRYFIYRSIANITLGLAER